MPDRGGKHLRSNPETSSESEQASFTTRKRWSVQQTSDMLSRYVVLRKCHVRYSIGEIFTNRFFIIQALLTQDVHLTAIQKELSGIPGATSHKQQLSLNVIQDQGIQGEQSNDDLLLVRDRESVF